MDASPRMHARCRSAPARPLILIIIVASDAHEMRFLVKRPTLMAAAMAVWSSRLGQARPSKIAVIDPPFNKQAVSTLYFSQFNERWRQNPCRIHRGRQRSNQSFLGFKLGALMHLERMWFFSNCGREACTDACARRSRISGQRTGIKFLL